MFEGALTPGRYYKIEFKATFVDTAAASLQEHIIYVYQTLRHCSVTAYDLTELEEVIIIVSSSTYMYNTTNIQNKYKINNIFEYSLYVLHFYCLLFLIFFSLWQLESIFIKPNTDI